MLIFRLCSKRMRSDEIKIKKEKEAFSFLLVRVEGLEPAHLSAPDPKSGVSTNFTTPAKSL